MPAPRVATSDHPTAPTGGMSSPGAVDSFAFYIAGPAWKRGQISDKSLLRV
jgi:hypothetical protein